ncbi:hypothetical protein BS47DRAFT_775421 [Hydnum rufescens UP504]|uniref:Protein CPL1-like domain-containing protein n=1 Tax=Hydnum rufescens UP504 TaxID=1448309 RepID=A0A9P6B1J1_9AGAM|nr:hypothetical protein BS47DRAFT_775421 [Hydnum rufescens UP504]
MRLATKLITALAATAGFVSASTLQSKRGFVDICAPLDGDLKILGVNYGKIDVCLCVSAIPAFIKTDPTGKKASKHLGEPYLTDYLTNLTETTPGAQDCQYPDHAIPACTPNCGFTCQPPYVMWGGTCVLPPSSGLKKRGLDIDLDEDLRCAWGLTKCGAWNQPVAQVGFECLDTRSHLESCGGCTLAFGTNEATGQDCTAIPGVLGVLCEESKCVVHSCRRGWVEQVDDEGVMSCVKKED